MIDSVLSVMPGSEGRNPFLGDPSSAHPLRTRAAARPRSTSRRPRDERVPMDGDRTFQTFRHNQCGQFRQDQRPAPSPYRDWAPETPNEPAPALLNAGRDRLQDAQERPAGDVVHPGGPWVVPAGPTPARRTSEGQWKESPQAHEPPAFGLSIVKPCFSIVSAKSMVAPAR